MKQFIHSHELYDALVEHVRDFAVVLLDPQGRVATWNAGARRILGYEEAEIVGRDFKIFFTPEDQAAGRPQNELEQARSRGSCEDDNWLVRKDGSRLYASGVTTRLVGEPLRGFAKFFRDQSERRRLEEEAQRRVDTLAAADRHKDEFLAMLSHELRGPLAPIMNALEILRMDPPATVNSRNAHAILERQVRHMTRLVDDLLDVARISKGKIGLRMEPMDLDTVLERALESSRPLIHGRHHTLLVARPEQPVPLMADPARLQQAITNLLANAAKYTPPGGRIWVEAGREAGTVSLSVRDNGIGIDAELLPNVFDLFVQGSRTPDRAQGGLGIGLTLVKHIARMHGGTVSAQSSGRGQGSEFTLRLPIAHCSAGAERASAETMPPCPSRILVVDDSLDTADSLAMLLKLDGYEVRTANDGIGALNVAREFRPDFMLVDIGLPGADGYTVAERVQREPGLAAVTLVAMSGYGQSQDRARSCAAGFREHLVKPVDLAALQALLARRAPTAAARTDEAAQASPQPVRSG